MFEDPNPSSDPTSGASGSGGGAPAKSIDPDVIGLSDPNADPTQGGTTDAPAGDTSDPTSGASGSGGGTPVP